MKYFPSLAIQIFGYVTLILAVLGQFYIFAMSESLNSKFIFVYI